jgi:hypothetical protein
MMCHRSDNLNLHTSVVLTGPRNYSLKHLNDFHLLLSKGKKLQQKKITETCVALGMVQARIPCLLIKAENREKITSPPLKDCSSYTRLIMNNICIHTHKPFAQI